MSAFELVANIDLDGTVADFDMAMHVHMVAMQAPEEKPFEFGDLMNFDNLPPYLEERMRSIKDRPGFWDELKPIPLGMEVVELMRYHGYKLQVLTKGPGRHPVAWAEKVRWSQKYLPDAGISITTDKGLAYGRVLFDDWPPYIERWLTWRPRGKVFMRDTPGNRHFSHPNVIRVSSMDDLKAVSEALIERAKSPEE